MITNEYWDKHELAAENSRLREELATLRAKAEAYDKGAVMWGIYLYDELNAVGCSPDDAWVSFILSSSQTTSSTWPAMTLDEINKAKNHCEQFEGYTCRKVRVCDEVEGPALANKEKGTI